MALPRGRVNSAVVPLRFEMKEDCFAFGIGGIVVGTVAVLSSVTKTGRDLDRAYLRTLPKSMRAPKLEPLRNPIAAVVGGIFIVVGVCVLGYALYCWLAGIPCG